MPRTQETETKALVTHARWMTAGYRGTLVLTPPGRTLAPKFALPTHTFALVIELPAETSEQKQLKLVSHIFRQQLTARIAAAVFLYDSYWPVWNLWFLMTIFRVFVTVAKTLNLVTRVANCGIMCLPSVRGVRDVREQSVFTTVSLSLRVAHLRSV